MPHPAPPPAEVRPLCPRQTRVRAPAQGAAPAPARVRVPAPARPATRPGCPPMAIRRASTAARGFQRSCSPGSRPHRLAWCPTRCRWWSVTSSDRAPIPSLSLLAPRRPPCPACRCTDTPRATMPSSTQASNSTGIRWTLPLGISTVTATTTWWSCSTRAPPLASGSSGAARTRSSTTTPASATSGPTPRSA